MALAAVAVMPPAHASTSTHPHHMHVVVVVEQAMMRASAALRSKPEWGVKLMQPEIRAKWKNEMMEQVRGRSAAMGIIAMAMAISCS